MKSWFAQEKMMINYLSIELYRRWAGGTRRIERCARCYRGSLLRCTGLLSRRWCPLSAPIWWKPATESNTFVLESVQRLFKSRRIPPPQKKKNQWESSGISEAVNEFCQTLLLKYYLDSTLLHQGSRTKLFSSLMNCNLKSFRFIFRFIWVLL